jgi:hypothetical protein
MKRIKLFQLCLFISIVGQATDILACTSFIVSGKATPDGRPLLFKNRDTDNLNNVCVYIKGDKYDFVGVVTADSNDDEVWYGHNVKGFAIMNTAAYNLNSVSSERDRSLPRDREGIIMKMALGQCATLEDFENMLDTLSKPLGSDANFGVIDANGGCAFYETGNDGYVKFDANDEKVAPYGYLVRTNHGFSGDRNRDKGISRFNAISELCLKLSNVNGFTVENIIGRIPRYLIHGLTGLNLNNYLPTDYNDTQLMPFRDFIPRYITASAVLIQGVKKNESPLLTVSWTIIGSPLTTVAVPVVLTPAQKIPALLGRGENGSSLLCEWGLSLKKQLFPITRGEGADYIDLSKLINTQQTGILQKVQTIEKEVLDKGIKELEKARGARQFDKSINEYYAWVDSYLTRFYQTEYPEIFSGL